MRPSIGRRAFVPFGVLSPEQVRDAKARLKFTETREDAVTRAETSITMDELAETMDQVDDPWVKYSKTGKNNSLSRITVNEYRECRGGISLPRAWAMSNFPNINWKDRTVFPIHDIPDRAKIEPRDERQSVFFERLMREATEPGPQDILANATTGAGKSVAGVFMGWQLRTPTLIIVDRNRIADGWLKNLRQFYGQGWVTRNVGRVQAGTIDYKGKAFVISLAQSLARRQYPRDFYRAFGHVIVDEVQVFGGPFFCPVLHMFPARVRTYFTAENRAGEFGRRIRSHAGEPRVISKQEVLKPDAWIITNKLTNVFYAQSDGALLNNLAYNVTERNQKLAGLIYRRGYQRRRNVLVLSNRTAQLVELKRMLVERGVPEEQCGIHVGKYRTHRSVVYYTLPGSKKRNRIRVCETYGQARSLIRYIELQRWDRTGLIQKTLVDHIRNGVEVQFSTSREEYKPTQHELDNITHSCQIILATYEIFAKGIDVPRLDMGVEALPSGNVKQPLGRVLRILDGKAKPEWYAIHDVLDTDEIDDFELGSVDAKILVKFFGAKTKARVAALKRAGARIKYA